MELRGLDCAVILGFLISGGVEAPIQLLFRWPGRTRSSHPEMVAHTHALRRTAEIDISQIWGYFWPTRALPSAIGG